MPDELAIELEPERDHSDLVRCRRQKTPARRLANLARIPVVLVTGEAACDHCTVKYLREAGVEEVDFIRLEEPRTHGNGHLLMLEKNSAGIAALVADWLVGAVR